MVFSDHVTMSAPTNLRDKALQALGELPPFSPILSKLLATLAKDDASFGLLGDLIEKDVVVAGNVLHLVNSAAYARRTKINSIRHAISVLGVNKLRNAVLGMSVARMWKSVTMPAGWSTARFNQHSAATAILSDLLVQHATVEYPEGAFVSGLLHDIGLLLIAWSLPQRYAEIQARVAGGVCWDVAEREVLGFNHADLSAEALAVWKLPEPILTAVRAHQEPTSLITLGLVLGAADRYVDSIGLSIQVESVKDPETGHLEAMGLDPSLIAALVADFQVECRAMMQFLQ
jgi:HD-like signal output (HDOD) protein